MDEGSNPVLSLPVRAAPILVHGGMSLPALIHLKQCSILGEWETKRIETPLKAACAAAADAAVWGTKLIET